MTVMEAVNLPKAKTRPRTDLESAARFFNRELSWLAFNERVMQEADNPNHPLLERLRFLSISSSNLDEFYMVRVAGLKGQVEAGIKVPSEDGMTPQQQLDEINARAKRLITNQLSTWRSLTKELDGHGISVVEPAELSEKELDWLEAYFLDEVFPVLTPLAVDPAHPFPFIPNLGVAIALELKSMRDGEPLHGLIRLSDQIPRFVQVPGKTTRYLPHGAGGPSLHPAPVPRPQGAVGRLASASSATARWKSTKRPKTSSRCSRRRSSGASAATSSG